MNNTQKNPKAKQQNKTGSKNEAKGGGSKPARSAGRNEMQHHFDLAAELAKLPPATASELPSHPVARVTLDAARLYQAAVQVRERLAGLPTFKVEHIDELPILADGLDEAERAWGLSQSAKKTRASHDARERGEQLRSDLLQSGRYLLRDDATVLAELDGIAAGSTIPDLVQGLNGLAKIVEAHATVFASDDTVDPQAAKRCRAIAAELTASHSEVNTAGALARRNQIHHLLATRVKEVRAAAAYVFRKEPQMLTPFASALNAAKRKKPATAAEQEPAKAEGDPKAK